MKSPMKFHLSDEECLAIGFDRVAFLRTPAAVTDDRLETTWVYVMQCGDFVKVGIANDVDRRREDLQAGNPYAIRVKGRFQHPSRLHALLCERTIHAVLDDAHHYREWFCCPLNRALKVARAVNSATKAIRQLHLAEWEVRGEIWRAREVRLGRMTPEEAAQYAAA